MCYHDHIKVLVCNQHILFLMGHFQKQVKSEIVETIKLIKFTHKSISPSLRNSLVIFPQLWVAFICIPLVLIPSRLVLNPLPFPQPIFSTSLWPNIDSQLEWHDQVNCFQSSYKYYIRKRFQFLYHGASFESELPKKSTSLSTSESELAKMLTGGEPPFNPLPTISQPPHNNGSSGHIVRVVGQVEEVSPDNVALLVLGVLQPL